MPSKALLQTLSYNNLQKQSWPEQPDTLKIGQCFQLLQKFIKDSNNWNTLEIPQETIKFLEENLNNIIFLLLAQKQYALQFWNLQMRRIQASICHFLIIFQNFMAFLITPPYKTLKLAQKKRAFSTHLSYIEQLVNKIIENLYNLPKFLSKKQFKQQKQASKQFCQIFKNLVENLPNMTSTQLKRIPKLMHYIYINNPIEISKNLFQDSRSLKLKIRKNRSKIETIKKNGQLYKDLSLIDKKFKNIFFYKNHFIQRYPRRKTCLGRLQRKHFQQDIKKITVFKFPQKQVKFSFINQSNILTKKITQTTSTQEQPRPRKPSLSQNRKYFRDNVIKNIENQKNRSKNITIDPERFVSSLQNPKKKTQPIIRGKSQSHISEQVSKKSKKSRQRMIIKNLIESQQEVKRQNKQKAKDAVFTLVKNLWSQIKFNQQQYAKKQPIQLDSGRQKRPLWAPLGYQQNKQDDLKQRIQDILYQDSQEQEDIEYIFPD